VEPAAEVSPEPTESRPRRQVPRWLASRWVVVVPVLALAACLAFELTAAVAVVVEEPLALYVDNGFRVAVQWPRLAAFAAVLLLDVVLLVAGAVRIARRPAGPVEEDGCQPTRVADWTVRVTAVFPPVVLAYLVGWAALGDSNPTGVPHQTAALQRVVGAVALAIAVLSLVLLVPALRLLRRGPFRTGWPAAVGAVVLAVVTVGVPFAATCFDPPTGTPPEDVGFAELVPAPSPRLDHVFALACGSSSDCLALSTVRGLESQIRYGLAATADGGRTWHSALLPEGVEPTLPLTCTGTECWNPTTSLGAPERRNLATVSIGPTGRPTVHLRRMTTAAPDLLIRATCWSASNCLGLSYPPPARRASPSGAVGGLVADFTTDGGAHWSTAQLPLPTGLSAPANTYQELQGPWCTLNGTCLAGLQAVPSGCPPAARPSAACPLRLVVLRTTDGGATWQSWDPLPARPRPTVLLCTALPECLANDSLSRSHQTYVLSSDTGETWGPARPFGRQVEYVACSISRCIRRVELSGTRSRLEISTDGGRRWRLGPSGIGSDGIAECASTGHCLTTFTSVLDRSAGLTGSAVVAVSGPRGHWVTRTLPIPSLPRR
jgi:hypothetical protein